MIGFRKNEGKNCILFCPPPTKSRKGSLKSFYFIVIHYMTMCSKMLGTTLAAKAWTPAEIGGQV